MSRTILARLRFVRGDFEGAASAAREAISLRPAHPGAVGWLARALVGLGRASEARDLCRAHLAADPGRYEVLLGWFHAALALGNLDEAEAAVDQLLARSADGDTFLAAARLAAARGDRAGATEFVRRALDAYAETGAQPDDVAPAQAFLTELTEKTR